jgi:ribosomal protein S27E
MIRVQCPRCGHGFIVEDEMRGRQDRCPQCATPVPVPATGDAPASSVVARVSTTVTVPLSDADADVRPEFDRYLDALAAHVERLTVFAPTGPAADLVIPVTLATGGRGSFTVLVNPSEQMPDTAGLAAVFQALFGVKPPVTRGPAAEATLVFAVRGGAGR